MLIKDENLKNKLTHLRPEADLNKVETDFQGCSNFWGNRISEHANYAIKNSYCAQYDQQISFVSVFFDDLEDRLCDFIKRYPVIVGCVAQVTNYKILKALSEKERVSLIIKKLDFTTDGLGIASFHRLKHQYSKISFGVTNRMLWSGFRHFSGDYSYNIVNSLNVNYDWTSEPIRVIDSDGNSMMHNKFIVGCQVLSDVYVGDFDGQPTYYDLVVPKAVWTGSFNFTENGTKSFENAVAISSAYSEEFQKNGCESKNSLDKALEEIQDDGIGAGNDPADAFFLQWQRLFAISEGFPEKLWTNANAPHRFSLIA